MYITIQDIKSKYKPDLKGILHFGAHLAEEVKDYAEVGCKRVIWVEGNPALIDALRANVSGYEQNKVYSVLISDKDKTKVIFNITEFSQSSSILDLGITKEVHDTRIIERKELVARRMDAFLSENGVDMDQYNFLNIDLQGYELTAIKSMGKLLDKIDWVYTEVNRRHVYKKCVLLDELDLFLLNKGFRRVEICMTGWHWGDALYQRKKIGALEYMTTCLKIGVWSVRNRIFGRLSDRIKKDGAFTPKLESHS
jgi:FkbM family methyltransferase